MVSSSNPSPTVRLNSGFDMPLLGLGVYDMHGRQAEKAIRSALDIGYRLIDTATLYGNEKEVGRAIRESGLPREEIFVTSKLANTDQGYDSALQAFERSLRALDIGYIDLYLVHWPIRGKRSDSWKALEKIIQGGHARSIGVANYLLPFLEELRGQASVVPAVDQVEFSPFLYLQDLLLYCRRQGIQLQAYTPLARGARFNHPLLQQLSDKYGKSPAQLMLRWILEQGVSAIPKSANPARQAENFDVFDFELEAEDLEAMNGLNENFRVVDDPMEYW